MRVPRSSGPIAGGRAAATHLRSISVPTRKVWTTGISVDGSMTGGITTYRARRGIDAAALLAALRRDGYEVGEPEPVTRTVLDTFDGRLAAAGLRLELTTPSLQAGDRLRGSSCCAAPTGRRRAVVVSGMPSIANDVPPGPFRFRLAKLLDVRVLIPLVALSGAADVGDEAERGAGRRRLSQWSYDAPHVGERRIAEQLVDVGGARRILEAGRRAARRDRGGRPAGVSRRASPRSPPARPVSTWPAAR